MENFTQPMWFELAAYSDIGNLKYLCFIIMIITYLIILFANSLIIGLVIVDKSLHKPMYYMQCSLLVNELYGSTAFYPFLLYHVLSDIHQISRLHCFLHVFVIYTYVSTEFINLAVMAYDRYVSICYPLQYINIMSAKNTYVLIAFIWLYSFGKFSVTFSMSVRLRLCGNRIDKIYCDNYSLVKLACEDTKVNNIYGLYALLLSVGLPLLLILYSYGEILKISLQSSKQSQKRALNTCIPHIVSLLNFSLGSLFEIIQSRFDVQNIPSFLRILLSLYFILICPLLNPIVYGIRTAKFKYAIKGFCTKVWPSNSVCTK